MSGEDDIVWSEIGSGFGDPGSTPSPKIPRSKPPVLRSHLHVIYIYNQLMREYYDLNTQLNKNITSEDEDENKMKVSIFESESKLFSVLKLSP